MNLNKESNINDLFTKFNEFIKSKTIVGDEIKVGSITLIPITDISFCISGGSGESSDKKVGNGGGSFAAIAAKATPKAILMIKGNDTKLFPVNGTSSLELLMKNVPGLIEKINNNKE